MSMCQNRSTTPAAPQPNWPWDRMCLARYVARRREELRLSIAGAAELAGLELSQWCALEEGWIPTTLAIIRPIAQTLCTDWKDLHTLAFLCEFDQECR